MRPPSSWHASRSRGSRSPRASCPAAAADARRIAALEQALDLARGLGLVVAAAGCDSAADFDLLLQLGCRHAEGAFIADAMPGCRAAGLGRRLEPTVDRRRVRMSAPLSLRRLLAILLGVLGVLVAALFVVTTLQLRGANFQAEAENRRTESFLLADQMRQSSNDLTNLVRLYVSTGDARYRDYYDEILAIRAGTAPRPRGYDSSFWNRVLAEGKGFVEYGRPESLIDQMRAARFTAPEFARPRRFPAGLERPGGARAGRDGARRAAHPAGSGRQLLRRRPPRLRACWSTTTTWPRRA